MTEQRAGQVWRWHVGGEDLGDNLRVCLIEEFYLLLWPEPMGRSWAHAIMDADHMMWTALNLETGVLDFVTPEYTAGEWELME